MDAAAIHPGEAAELSSLRLIDVAGQKACSTLE